MLSPNEVIPSVYIGSARDLDPISIAAFKITHVLTIGRDMILPANLCVRNFVIPVEDQEHEPIWQYFGIACSRIDEFLGEGGVVLVHCLTGVSRSATIVAAYLLHKRQAGTVDDALRMIATQRPEIYPNGGFQEQLREWHCLEHQGPSRWAIAPKYDSPPGLEHQKTEDGGDGEQ